MSFYERGQSAESASQANMDKFHDTNAPGIRINDTDTSVCCVPTAENNRPAAVASVPSDTAPLDWIRAAYVTSSARVSVRLESFGIILDHHSPRGDNSARKCWKQPPRADLLTEQGNPLRCR